MEKVTLVLGATTNPQRYAFEAVRSLVARGHKVVAVGNKKGQISGVEITNEMPDENIDTVTLYIGPERQRSYYDAIIKLNPRRVIFNPGTENEDFFRRLNQKNIRFEIACTLVMLSVGNY